MNHHCASSSQMEGLTATGSVVTMRVITTGEELSVRSKSAAVPSTRPARTPSSTATVMQTTDNGNTRGSHLRTFLHTFNYKPRSRSDVFVIGCSQVLRQGIFGLPRSSARTEGCHRRH